MLFEQNIAEYVHDWISNFLMFNVRYHKIEKNNVLNYLTDFVFNNGKSDSNEKCICVINAYYYRENSRILKTLSRLAFCLIYNAY